jgi:hypothetical protein
LATPGNAAAPALISSAGIRTSVDPSLAGEFDAKFGAGSAALHLQQTAEMTDLLHDLLKGLRQRKINAKLDVLIETLTEALATTHNDARIEDVPESSEQRGANR